MPESQRRQEETSASLQGTGLRDQAALFTGDGMPGSDVGTPVVSRAGGSAQVVPSVRTPRPQVGRMTPATQQPIEETEPEVAPAEVRPGEEPKASPSEPTEPAAPSEPSAPSEPATASDTAAPPSGARKTAPKAPATPAPKDSTGTAVSDKPAEGKDEAGPAKAAAERQPEAKEKAPVEKPAAEEGAAAPSPAAPPAGAPAAGAPGGPAGATSSGGSGAGLGGDGEAGAPAQPPPVEITAEDPGAILGQLSKVPPVSAVDAYKQAQAASAGALDKQRQAAEDALPKMPAPTGLPATAEAGRQQPEATGDVGDAAPVLTPEGGGPAPTDFETDVEEAPPAPKAPTRLAGGEGKEGEGDSDMSRSAQSALSSVTLDTSQIGTNAGPPPTVPLTGEADPAQLATFQQESGTEVRRGKLEAAREIDKDFGENNIFPAPTDEILAAGKPLSPAPAPEGSAAVPAPGLPPEAIGGLNQSLGPIFQQRLGEQKAKYDSGKQDFDRDTAQARTDADKQVADLKAEAQQKQIDEQGKAKTQVAEARKEWQEELDKVEQDYEKKAGKATQEQQQQIDAEKKKGEDKAAQHIKDAEEKAEKERVKAEKEADKKKAEAKEESGGFWGWVKSKAKALIDGLKAAVNFIYDNLRKLVKGIFELAKKLVVAALELARTAIVGLIKAYGAILKGLVTVAFAAFPGIAKRINAKIDAAVNAAVKAVNTVAGWLKKGISAILDFLASAIDKLLGLIQSLYNGILTVVGMIISGEFVELMKKIGNLVEAAKQMPDHFWGQAQEEVIGMNLTEPLPFERKAPPMPDQAATAGQEAGAISGPDAALLTQKTLRPNDVAVDQVATLTEMPPFLAGLNLSEGQEIEFGESSDPGRSVEAIQAELLGTAAAGQDVGTGTEPPSATPTPTAAGPAAAMPVAKTPEQELEEMMAQTPEGGCVKEKSAEPAKNGEIPEHLKKGPFTPAQRGRYMWHQMKQGVKQWFSCNWPWLLAGAVGALVGFIALNILTGGAVLAALPALMQIVGAVMAGVALATVTKYVGEYLSLGWQGKIGAAAKALARGLAAGAIELIFALLFNLGAVIKAMRGGLKASIKAAATAAKTTVTTTIKNVRHLGKLGAQGAKTALKNGRLMMSGIKSGVVKGAKSLDDLAKRLWQRVRFRKFKVQIKNRRFRLLGYLNPWVLLADGSLQEFDVDAVDYRMMGVKGPKGGILVDWSRHGHLFRNMEPDQLRFLHKQLDELPDAAARMKFLEEFRLASTDPAFTKKLVFLGEADLSFTRSLAKVQPELRRAITPTTYEEFAKLVKHPRFQANLDFLKKVYKIDPLESVDAQYLRRYFADKSVDQLTWLFPHIGDAAKGSKQLNIDLHQKLFDKFFGSAQIVLKDEGRIMMALKDSPMYRYLWDVPGVASAQGFVKVSEEFMKYKKFLMMYPGYGHQMTKGGGGAVIENMLIYFFKKVR